MPRDTAASQIVQSRPIETYPTWRFSYSLRLHTYQVSGSKKEVYTAIARIEPSHVQVGERLSMLWELG